MFKNIFFASLLIFVMFVIIGQGSCGDDLRQTDKWTS